MRSQVANVFQIRCCLLILVCACLLTLNVGSIALGEGAVDPVLLEKSDNPQIQKFTTDELRALVAPIALYPDALLSQVLPASAYPLDIVQAYRHSQSSKTPTEPPPNISWDSSVIALLHYPTVLKKMSDDLQWTEQLGIAVTYQTREVSDTIQQVRAEAQAAGNLPSNDKQVVIQEPDVIRIEPANPNIIYVPSYDPGVIFEVHDSWVPYFTFGIGLGCGIWFDNYWDWHHHCFHRYNGWHNGSWSRLPHHDVWYGPHRPVQSWYQKGAVRTPPVRSGYRSGINPSGRRITPPPSTGSGIRHNDATGAPKLDVRRESNRGGASRRSALPPQVHAPRSTPQYTPSHQNQNMMRPSDNRTTHSESSRGAASRGFGGGGGRGGGRR